MTRRASHHSAALIALFAAACIFAASCSTSDDSAATTSTTPPTTAPPTTAPPTTTAPTTTTTEQPADTIDPVTAAEQAASQAVLDKAEAWRGCIDDVPSCDPQPAMEPSTSGQALANLVDAIEEWQTNGWEARPPLDPTHVGEEIISTELVTSDEAQVTYCQIDGGQLVDPGAGPDGSDVVVNDDIVSLLANAFVLRDADDTWRVERTEILKSIEGGDGCGANT